MKPLLPGERGQAAVEFAIFGLALMMLTAGLIDVGRAFFEYNAVSAAARYGARWGSVVGGTCALPNSAVSVNDWCTQLATTSGTNFWQQVGTAPLQGPGNPCPSYDSTPGDYYTASDPDNDSDIDVGSSTGDTDGDGSKVTSITGAVAQHFDSSDSPPSSGGNAWSFVTGAFTPGFDLSRLMVCVAISSSGAIPAPGDTVQVTVHYPFNPVSALLPAAGMELNATSQFEVE